MKVDVMTVLSGACECLRTGQKGYVSIGNQLEVAQENIAELIAADEEYDRIRNRMYLLLLADPRRDALEEELKVCSARRAAALLACKGQDHER